MRNSIGGCKDEIRSSNQRRPAGCVDGGGRNVRQNVPTIALSTFTRPNNNKNPIPFPSALKPLTVGVPSSSRLHGVHFYCRTESIFIYCRAHTATIHARTQMVCVLEPRSCCSTVLFALRMRACVCDVRVYNFRQFKFIIIGESISRRVMDVIDVCVCVGFVFPCYKPRALSHSTRLH